MVADGLCEAALAVAPVESSRVRFVSLKREPLYLFGSTSVLSEQGAIEPGTSLFLLDRNFKLDRILLEEKRSLVEGLQIRDGFDGYSMIVKYGEGGPGRVRGPACYLQTADERQPVPLAHRKRPLPLGDRVARAGGGRAVPAAQRFVAYALGARLD